MLFYKTILLINYQLIYKSNLKMILIFVPFYHVEIKLISKVRSYAIKFAPRKQGRLQKNWLQFGKRLAITYWASCKRRLILTLTFRIRHGITSYSNRNGTTGQYYQDLYGRTRVSFYLFYTVFTTKLSNLNLAIITLLKMRLLAMIASLVVSSPRYQYLNVIFRDRAAQQRGRRNSVVDQIFRGQGQVSLDNFSGFAFFFLYSGC